jgi:hypothetical protein
MIIDLPRFILAGKPLWTELEKAVERFEPPLTNRPTLEDTRRFHYLYQRAAADLVRVGSIGAEPELHRYLESLVARAYGRIHDNRERNKARKSLSWLWREFPRVVRRHAPALWLAVALMMVPAMIAGVWVGVDPDAKEALIPAQFAYHRGSQEPGKRVGCATRYSRGSYWQTTFELHFSVSVWG